MKHTRTQCAALMLQECWYFSCIGSAFVGVFVVTIELMEH